jgi:methyl-accepting chemotaxis protein
VADEIRKLAESSGAQAKTVSSVLKKIKDAMDAIAKSAEQIRNQFEDMNTKIRNVAERELTIRNAMDEQGVGSKQILEAISRLNGITSTVQSGSREMLTGSGEVILRTGFDFPIDVNHLETSGMVDVVSGSSTGPAHEPDCRDSENGDDLQPRPTAPPGQPILRGLTGS